MFALLEIARIYKALNCFADLQGPICYKDAQNTEVNLIAGLPRARSARGTEPHTHGIWSTSFRLVVT